MVSLLFVIHILHVILALVNFKQCQTDVCLIFCLVCNGVPSPTSLEAPVSTFCKWIIHQWLLFFYLLKYIGHWWIKRQLICPQRSRFDKRYRLNVFVYIYVVQSTCISYISLENQMLFMIQHVQVWCKLFY